MKLIALLSVVVPTVLSLSATAHAQLLDEAVPAEFVVGNKPGAPLDNLPANTRVISSFGERPVFSPDGKKIAFMGETLGDAFEYDIATGETRNLTGHFPHKGFYRVHYLSDGSFLLLGIRALGSSPTDTRLHNNEMFWLDAAAAKPAVPLDQKLFEGVAVSRLSNRIVWGTISGSDHPLKHGNKGTSTLMVGDLVHGEGSARLQNVRKVRSNDWTSCSMEGQDFLANDTEVTVPCYTQSDPGGKYSYAALVWTVRLADGRVTNYPLPKDQYGEVEGLVPGTRKTLIECRTLGKSGTEMCLMDLTEGRQNYKRLTRVLDYGPYGFTNGVVSPDRRHVAFHYSYPDKNDGPGSGHGVLLMEVPAGI